MDIYDVIIVGSGPAGLCAAIYTARAELKTLVLGILQNSNAYKAHIFENYMAFENPVTGPYLMETSQKQAQRFGAKFVPREIVDISRRADGIFLARDTEEESYAAKHIIICSGLGFKPSGIKREKEMTGKGVSYCVTCDGPFFKNKKVIVVGHGDYAADEALQLTAFTSDIGILSHGKDFIVNQKMKNLLASRGIRIEKTKRIQSIEGLEKVEKIVFIDGSARETEGVFVAIGIAGAADFANKLGIERNGAYIVANPKTGETNVKGVYAAGDCTGGNAQAAKSGGEGCNAAISVIKSLKGMAAYVDYS